MKEQKAEGWQRKRKARDKANLRLLKNKAWIVPSMLALVGAGFLVGGTSSSFVTDDWLSRLTIGLVAGVVFLIVGAHRVINQLSTSTGGNE
jgi:hypothetical protein